MTKMKKLLLALLTGTACASMIAFVGCSDGDNNDNEDYLPDGSTDITEEDVPLGGSDCGHERINHVAAVSAGCETAGNKEYWYCSDCNKYFSDENYTVETSLAAVTLTKLGHSYGEWIKEDSATCTEDGVKAHKDCTECNKHFDAENNEITDLTIEAGHSYGEWIKEVPATTCTNGTKAHYHCDVCNKDFDENKQEFVLPLNDITIYAQHSFVLVKEKEATCEEDGVMESYRHCTVCGRDYDEFALREIVPGTLAALGHSYGEFVYNYETKKYVKVCGNDETHTIEQAAGTAEYPYLANDEDSFKSAIATGGYVKLTADIDLRANETSDKTYYIIMTDTVLDLNGYTLTTKRGFQVGTKADPAAPSFTVKNGAINRVVDSGSTANIAALSAYGSGELSILNCSITTNQDTAVSVFDFGKVTATDSALKGVYYGLGSNAGTGNYSDAIYVKLTNCELDSQYAGLLWGVPASIQIEGCEIKGIGQAVIARGGNITISNSTLIKRAGVAGVDSDRAINGDVNIYAQYESKTWSTGSYVPGYALVVGNRYQYEYQYATNLTLNNVKVEVEKGVVQKYVYAYGNTTPEYGATITYDAACSLGEIVIGDKDAANGSNVTVFTVVSTADEFVAALANGGNILLSSDIDLTGIETENAYYVTSVDTVLDLNGYTLTTTRGFQVGDNDNASTPVFKVLNGTVIGNSNGLSTLTAQGSGELEILNCSIINNCAINYAAAVSVLDLGKVTATDSTLKGVAFGLGSNAGTGNYTNAIYVKLTNCEIDAQGAGVLWTIPASIKIDGCEIKGLGQAVIARGGNVTISNSALIKRAYVEGSDLAALANGDEKIYADFENTTWESGNGVPGYALVVGNRSNSYQYATNVTLNNVKVEVEEGVVQKYVYAYGNTNPAYGATITYDADCSLGEIVIGDKDAANGSNVTVNAPVNDVELAA